MKQTILFLRNGNLFASKEAALTGINNVAHVAGQPVVALYGEAGSVKLIFAIGTEEGKCEIMATDADRAALAELVAQLRIDVDAITNTGIDAKIEAAISALKGEGFDAANLAALEDSVDANTAALVKLNGADTEEGSVAKAVKEAKEAAAADAQAKIEALDVDEITESGKYIVAVSEADGKISARTKEIEASEVAVKDEEGHFAAENVEAALHELYTQAGAGSKVTMKSDAGEGDVATIYSFYQGGEDDAHKIGEINIGKELMVKEGVVEDDENGVPHLKLTINDEAGTVVDIDLSKVFDVYTQGNGITVGTDKKIAVKKADDSEAFLVVDENGVAIKGVQTAINTAKEEAIAAAKTETENQVKAAKDTIDAYTVNGKTISGNPVLGAADIDYAEGVTVAAKLDAIAGDAAQAVADEKKRAEEAEAALQEALDGEIERAKAAELALTEITEDIAAELHKVKLSADDETADYLANKVVSGVADEANNTYAATVAANEAGALAITVKIDKIDGGTY